MNKQLTGLKIEAKAFRKLNECLRCGKASRIRKKSICADCKVANLKNCEICDILLRDGLSKFYTYDSQDSFRENNNFKVSANFIREFTYDVFFKKPVGKLCDRCIDWETRMTKWCWKCESYFENSKSNYKLNGNMCRRCSRLFPKYKNHIIYGKS